MQNISQQSIINIQSAVNIWQMIIILPSHFDLSQITKNSVIRKEETKNISSFSIHVNISMNYEYTQ